MRKILITVIKNSSMCGSKNKIILLIDCIMHNSQHRLYNTFNKKNLKNGIWFLFAHVQS